MKRTLNPFAVLMLASLAAIPSVEPAAAEERPDLPVVDISGETNRESSLPSKAKIRASRLRSVRPMAGSCAA